MNNSTAGYVLPVKLSKPAERAMVHAGIKSLAKLATWREEDIKALHGIGAHALAALNNALKENGLSFRDKK